MQSRRLLVVQILLVALASVSHAGCSESRKSNDGGGPDCLASGGDGNGVGGVCFSFLECDPGDEMLGHGGYSTDPTAYCPSGRECYILRWECGNTLCALPIGVHCSDPLACSSGEVATTPAQCSPSWCHTKSLCGKQIGCLSILDAGMADAIDSPAIDEMPGTGGDLGQDGAVVDGGSAPAGGPSCGSSTCAAGQLCIRPTCVGGTAPPCLPPLDGGACPTGLTYASPCIPGLLERGSGCTLPRCVDPPPFCIDLPAACGAKPTCGCLPYNVCQADGGDIGGMCGLINASVVSCMGQ